MNDGQQLVDAVRNLVLRHENGGKPYFNIQTFLAYRKADEFRRYCPDLNDSQCNLLNDIGHELEEFGKLFIGFDQDTSAAKYSGADQARLIELLLAEPKGDTPRSTSNDIEHYFDVIQENAVPYASLFIEPEDTETLGVISDDNWLERHAPEYGLECRNFAAAQAILSESHGILDPFEYLTPYVVPKPKIGAFLEEYLGLISGSSRNALEFAYKYFQDASAERGRIQDEHLAAASQEDWE